MLIPLFSLRAKRVHMQVKAADLRALTKQADADRVTSVNQKF